MTLNSAPILATSAKAFARSLLFSLGVGHVLIGFLAYTAIGAATVLLALLYVGLRIPRCSEDAIRSTARGRFTLPS
jgi:hypothetical protein